MRQWLKPLLAFFTKVVVSFHDALVSDTLDWINFTSITDYAVMYDLRLGLFLLKKVLSKHLLIFLSAVFSHLLRENFLKIDEEFIVQFSSTIALLAWKTLLVDLWSVTLKAFRKIVTVFNSLFVVEVIRLNDHAANFFLVSDNIFLTGLRFCCNFCATRGINKLSFALWSTFNGFHWLGVAA